MSSICGGATQFCDLQMREGIIVKHKSHRIFIAVAKLEVKFPGPL